MRIRLEPTMTAALLLSAMALLNAVMDSIGPGLSQQLAAAQPARARSPQGEFERLAVEICRENVTIIHDVDWAAACMANPGDDSAECTLPDARAAKLNAARWAAEDRCVDDARQVARVN
ncbi:MAG: hypothetical protein V4787_00425 [Pseudomonadota bacterium]